MPTLPPSLRPPETGFTLIEMLVVLTIMASAGLLLLGRPGGQDRLANDRDIARVAQKLSQLRRSALASGKPQYFDPVTEKLVLESAIKGGGNQLVFFGDGSSNGGSLKDGNGQVLFMIDWQSGRIGDVG